MYRSYLLKNSKKKETKGGGERELADGPLLLLFLSAPSIFFIFVLFIIRKGPKVIKDKRKL